MNRKRKSDGANEWLTEVVRVHGLDLWRYLSYYERDADVVDELLVDVLVRSLEHVDRLVLLAPAELRTWLHRTAYHVTSNHARAAMSRRSAEERLASEPSPVEPAAEEAWLESQRERERADRSVAIEVALASLREEDRRVLLLDANGAKGPEIASELAITHAAARQRLARARLAFRSAFELCASTNPDGGRA